MGWVGLGWVGLGWVGSSIVFNILSITRFWFRLGLGWVPGWLRVGSGWVPNLLRANLGVAVVAADGLDSWVVSGRFRAGFGRGGG